MSLSTIQQPKKAKKKNRSNTPQMRFDREWGRVQRLQKRNQALAAELKALASRVLSSITEQEQEFTQALYTQTEHLLGFFAKKSLTLWQRETLLDWLGENMHILMHHPFSGHLDTQALAEKMQATFEAFVGKEPPTESTTEDLDEPQEDLFDKGAAQEDNNPDPFDDVSPDEDESFFNRFYEKYSADREQAQTEERERAMSLDQLLKGSSINKLFRQIARVLHPDREQDQERQKLKHDQMSDLIDARDRADIPRLFALYSEHVGGSPLPMIEGDLDKVTQLLKARAKQLEEEKETILLSDPLHAMIYDRFYAKNESGIRRNIDAYLKSLRRQTRQERDKTLNITSLKTLKPYLEERAEQYEIEMYARRLRAAGRSYDDMDIPF